MKIYNQNKVKLGKVRVKFLVGSKKFMGGGWMEWKKSEGWGERNMVKKCGRVCKKLFWVELTRKKGSVKTSCIIFLNQHILVYQIWDPN